MVKVIKVFDIGDCWERALLLSAKNREQHCADDDDGQRGQPHPSGAIPMSISHTPAIHHAPLCYCATDGQQNGSDSKDCSGKA